MSMREPNVTPLPEPADVSAELEVVALQAEQSSKILQLAIAVITLMGVAVGVTVWLVAYVGEATADAVAHHSNGTHPSGVHKEAFDAHTKAFDAHVADADKRADRIERKLDALGSQAYGSPKRWKDAVKEKETP